MNCVEHWEYDRAFSDLGALQTAKQIRYSLQTTGGRHFVLRVEQSAGDVHQEIAHEFTADADTAQQVLCYMCENAVLPQILRDVMMDLREQGLIAMRG